jgi:hypothetical protein
VFKDYLKLLWDNSGQKKQLLLTGTNEALRFFQGGRTLTSVLSRDVALKEKFESIYDGQLIRVGELYKTIPQDVELST